MVPQLESRRTSGHWYVRSEANTRKFHGKKWSKDTRKIVNNKTVLILVLLCFVNCLREATAASNGHFEIITVPEDKSLSNLNKTCTNQEKHGFRIVELIKDMHFDFCSEFHPVFFLPRITTQQSENVTKKLEINVTLNDMQITQQNAIVSTIYTCTDIKDLYIKEQFYKKVFDDYDQLLDRTDDCTLQHRINCSLCKQTYREWTCSQFASERMTRANATTTHHQLPVCPNLFAKICHDCPSLEPDKSYGGYSLFQCVGYDHALESHCEDRCASFACLPHYNNTIVAIVTT